MLNSVDLQGRNAPGFRKGHAKGNLHAVDDPVIRVVDLRGITAKRRVSVTHQTNQQA